MMDLIVFHRLSWVLVLIGQQILNLQQDQVRHFIINLIEALLAAVGGPDQHPLLLQRKLEQLYVYGLIVNDEDFRYAAQNRFHRNFPYEHS